MTATPPLVVTLVLDDEARERFDRLRRAHFPPDRNHLAAHVTAFHALPGERPDDVAADLRDLAPGGPVAVTVAGVRFLGRGVAYDLSAPAAESARAELADRWRASLTAQDRQRWRPHVTVQNKVAPEVARDLHARLAADFAPQEVGAVGWALFRYRGGPWEHLADVPFPGRRDR